MHGDLDDYEPAHFCVRCGEEIAATGDTENERVNDEGWWHLGCWNEAVAEGDVVDTDAFFAEMGPPPARGVASSIAALDTDSGRAALRDAGRIR